MNLGLFISSGIYYNETNLKIFLCYIKFIKLSMDYNRYTSKLFTLKIDTLQSIQNNYLKYISNTGKNKVDNFNLIQIFRLMLRP